MIVVDITSIKQIHFRLFVSMERRELKLVSINSVLGADCGKHVGSFPRCVHERQKNISVSPICYYGFGKK